MKKNPEALSAFGLNLRRIRESREWSQQELADRASIPKKTLQRVELAKHAVGLDMLFSLARALELPSKDLLDIPGLEQKDKD